MKIVATFLIGNVEYIFNLNEFNIINIVILLLLKYKFII